MAMSSDSYMAAKLWSRVMGQIDGARGGSFSSMPGNVVSASIDTKSGLLATDASGSNVRTEYFTTGTQPTTSDTAHQTVNICSSSGYIATPSCVDVTSKSGIMRPYVPNGKVGDIGAELPHYFCNLHNPNPTEYPVESGKSVTIVAPPVTPPTNGGNNDGPQAGGGDGDGDGDGGDGGDAGGNANP